MALSFFVQNSEVGASALKVTFFHYCQVCDASVLIEKMPARSTAFVRQAWPSSYHKEINHSDGLQLPPLADCLISMILTSEWSRNHLLISFSNASSLNGVDENNRAPPRGLFAQNSLTFIARSPSSGAPKLLYVHLGKICVAVLRNKSRAAHWSPLVHCTMKIATIPVLGLTDKSVP